MGAMTCACAPLADGRRVSPLLIKGPAREPDVAGSPRLLEYTDQRLHRGSSAQAWARLLLEAAAAAEAHSRGGGGLAATLRSSRWQRRISSEVHLAGATDGGGASHRCSRWRRRISGLRCEDPQTGHQSWCLLGLQHLPWRLLLDPWNWQPH
jgi:hypothetical protein